MVKVTSYNFYKMGTHYEYHGTGACYECSPAVLECLKAQYVLTGWKITVDTPDWVRVTKIEDDLSDFIKG